VIRNSIVAKLWITIVAMVVLVLALLSLLLQQFFDNYVYQQQTSELTLLANRVQVMVVHHDVQFAQRVAEQLEYVQHANIAIQVPYQSNASLNQAYQDFSADQRLQFEKGIPVAIRTKGNGDDTLKVYLAFHVGTLTGMVTVMQQSSVLDEPISRITNLIVFAMFLGVLLTTGLAFVITKNLTRPLVQMNRVAEEMAKGNFDWQITVMTNDEVGRLGKTFNALTSDLERTIAELSMEKDQLSSILASLEDAVLAADLDGNVTLANPPAVRRLQSLFLVENGVPQASFLPEELKRLLGQVVTMKHALTHETIWQGRELVSILTPLHESDGERIRGVVIVMRDVTQERRLDRLRKDFIANVSHELRTPLSMMQGYTEALLDEFGEDPIQRRELTEIIHDEALRMKRLVNDLLDLAQLESGHFQMKFDILDINYLLHRTARKFQTLSIERNVTLQVHLDHLSLYVSGDADRLEQVFTNLLDNAIRHTRATGTVNLSTFHSKSHVHIRVEDTGSGIPLDDIPYIWERFYKADKARTRGNSGIGLGLPITRHIVLEHGGDIIVESKVDEGTSFIVIIPLHNTGT